MKKIIIGVIIVAVVAVGAFFGKQYYDDRYVGSDYYTVVPADYDITPQMQYTDNGEEMALGVVYNLVAYNAQGESKDVKFTILDKDSGWVTSGEYVQPGTYLLVQLSKQLMVGWGTISEDQVPTEILSKINAK
ncbi:hypothetical protein FACS189431_8530 [Alphaproteobacteria bacterium]|nr:hypothetical protein FACS189431_8530 [Alphaproteobacteria bacterium]